ncbi:diaphanous GTPase-binding domain-containing protein [Choanephora cucurbitarum]|nr:diaphanous GTPase-binding domain-containing protein [Choanephora cucurbitarum]
MDLFGRNKAKVKKRPVIDPPMIETATTTNTTQMLQHSPISPHSMTDDYITGVGRLLDTTSIRSSQSSTPSVDIESTNAEHMSEAEIEEFFERMLTRRGIHDATARAKMSSFPMEKKRLMVAQDIQSESNTSTTQTNRRGGGMDKKSEHQTESKGPEYYVQKLSDMSRGVNTKIVSHLAVGLRTMPLSWVRQFIDMQGLLVITDLLEAFNKTKNKQELSLSVEADLLKCFKALLNNRVKDEKKEM